MLNLLMATAAFLITHIGLSSTPLRGRIAARTGEKGFLGIYSLVALATLVWMIMAYDRAPLSFLWPPAPGLRHLPLLVMPLAAILLVAALRTSNPTAVGMEGTVHQKDVARGILRITRHPFQWAVVLWAAVHILANGDRASLIFFGGFLVLSLAGPWLIDRKLDASLGDDWRRFKEQTSIVPFAAIVRGRNRLALREIGWVNLGLGLGLFLLLLVLHPWLFGAVPY